MRHCTGVFMNISCLRAVTCLFPLQMPTYTLNKTECSYKQMYVCLNFPLYIGVNLLKLHGQNVETMYDVEEEGQR